MTPYVIAAKGLNRQAPGSRHLALPSPSRTQWAFGRVSGAPIGSAEASDPGWAVTLSVNDRFCYHFRRLGGVI